MINNSIEKFLLHAILWSFAFLAILYVLFLTIMVSNIIERRSLEAEARVLSNEVSGLQLSYLSMSNKVDLNFAYSAGFKETKATFTTRKALGLAPVPARNTQPAPNDL